MATEIFATALRFLSIKPTENMLEIGSSSLYHGYVMVSLAHNVDLIPVKNAFLNHGIPECLNLMIVDKKVDKKYDIAFINGSIDDYKPYLGYLEENGKMLVFHKIKDLGNNLALTDLKIVYKDGMSYTETKYKSFVMYHLGECNE